MNAIRSTMGKAQLSVRRILEHGVAVHGDSKVITGPTGDTESYVDFDRRIQAIAHALSALGVGPGDVVATCCWNDMDHLALYFTVPSMGAILQTVNPRLTLTELVHVFRDGNPRVLIVDVETVETMSLAIDALQSDCQMLVTTSGGAVNNSGLPSLSDIGGSTSAEFQWPTLREDSAAGICHTSGTTGNPKGVVYSHRSIYLHAMALCTANAYAISETDTVLLSVPMFHANAWGLPYAGWLAGADLVVPGRLTSSDQLPEMIDRLRPTVASGVPTVWLDVSAAAGAFGYSLRSLRLAVSGGSAVTREVVDHFETAHGVRMVQGWGMTETSPLLGLSIPPKHAVKRDDVLWRTKSGRILAGVELRIVDPHGAILPWDDHATGELQVRGPWITSSYLGSEGGDRFSEGWLRTGDIGRVDKLGYVTITDRLKDLIKSGGEWISPFDLEESLRNVPEIADVAVVGVPDPRWQERPLVCVVGAPDLQRLVGLLLDRFPRWMVPELWAILEAIPRTTLGKPDKVSLRRQYEGGELGVHRLQLPEP